MAKNAKRTVELPADPAAPYVPPEDASPTELEELAEQARTKALELLATNNGDPSEADIATAKRLRDARTAITERAAVLVQEAADRKAAIDELSGELQPPAAEGEGEGDDQETDEDGKPKPPAKKVEPDPDAGTENDPAGGGGGDPALVAAVGSRRRSAIRQAAAGHQSGRPVAPARRHAGSATLVAAAGLNRVPAGEVDWAKFGLALQERFTAATRQGRSRGDSGTVIELPVGSVQIPTLDKGLVAAGVGTGDIVNEQETMRAIEYAVSRQRLAEETGTDGSLTAAGGWCSPSETLYDLLDITTEDGLLDTPSITVTRGGVRYALGPDFTAVYVTNTANFTRTEAQAIAGTPTKPMVNIPCPAFTDNRMLVDGLFLTGDILTSRGYPEAYADYTRKALKAFAHYVNAMSIADQVTLSTAVDLSAGGVPAHTLSATNELLGGLELQIMDMRYKNRLSMTQPVEAVMPFWLKGNLRSDIAKRQGVEDAQKITDQDILDWFTIRGANVQFVYDWQDAFTGVATFGGATAITAWPLTAKVLLYPAGTFVRALNPVIELQAVYDSTLLQTNQFVSLFMEQGRLTLKRHWDARVINFSVVPGGATVTGAAASALGQL